MKLIIDYQTIKRPVEKTNPYQKQILTYDKFGQVDGGFINPKWEEWENLQGKTK